VGTICALAKSAVGRVPQLDRGRSIPFVAGRCFGRYWPETWSNNNPSLIGNGTYGFHPFQGGDDIGSFPSGHAARILGFATVWFIATPPSRVIGTVLCAAMLVNLVATNYHFVSDVIACSVLGGIVAAYAAYLGRLRTSSGNAVAD
jgi:membrane-associated phospholipid phosphatase